MSRCLLRLAFLMFLMVHLSVETMDRGTLWFEDNYIVAYMPITNETAEEQETSLLELGTLSSDVPFFAEIPFGQLVEQVCKLNRNTPNSIVRVLTATIPLTANGFRLNGLSLFGLQKLPLLYSGHLPLFLKLLNLRN